jgi:hypothetical protein
MRKEETGEEEREMRRERAPLVRYDIFRLYPSRAQSGIKQGPPHGLHINLAKNRLDTRNMYNFQSPVLVFL